MAGDLPQDLDLKGDALMFTDKGSVLELLALLRAHGVHRFVLCPGSRDIPIVEGLARMPENTCLAVTDERSAGFVSLGVINATGEPCAVVCTSGSALVNLHPAAAEAYYQKKPLLIISADRPRAWIGQLDGQTLPQAEALKGMVRYTADLPEVHDGESAWFCNRLINESLLLLKKEKLPVHINVPITEPFFEFPVEKLPEVRVTEEIVPQELAGRIGEGKKIWIVVGQEVTGEEAGFRSLAALGEKFPVIAEHLANLPAGTYVPNIDLVLSLLSEEEKERIAPDAVVYFGGHIVSKQLKRFIRARKPLVIHHTADSTAPDLFRCLRFILRGSAEEAADCLSQIPSDAGCALKEAAGRITSFLLGAPAGFNQLQLTGELLKRSPGDTRIHLANSSTVRYAEWFHRDAGLRYLCNRGANGIEGSVSEAAGCAMADPGHLHLLIIGDLAYFYDMNILSAAREVPNLRIALFNNAGGEIFASLPGLDLKGSGSRYILGTHSGRTDGWCRDCGIRYLKAQDAESFNAGTAALFEKDAGCTLLEIRTGIESDIAALKKLRSELQSILQEIP
jgi:2-succinyl-5-enolpyruvyl-6-hydroxy-3-cyclohexene-1-carboxylate synthase